MKESTDNLQTGERMRLQGRDGGQELARWFAKVKGRTTSLETTAHQGKGGRPRESGMGKVRGCAWGVWQARRWLPIEIRWSPKE